MVKTNDLGNKEKKQTYYGVIPRGPNLDTFTRRVNCIEKTVNTAPIVNINLSEEVKLDLTLQLLKVENPPLNAAGQLLKLSEYRRGDDAIIQYLAQPRSLHFDRLFNSSVKVVIRKENKGTGEKYENIGNGVCLAEDTVFTARHLLDDEKGRSKINSILVYDLEENSSRCRVVFSGDDNTGMFSSDDNFWTFYDLAVLRLETPFPKKHFLSVFGQPHVAHDESAIVCAFGFSGRSVADSVLMDMFPFKTIHHMKNLFNTRTTESLLRTCLSCSFANFEERMASFGTTKSSCDGSHSLVSSTMTALTGLSGSPVIDVAHPDLLEGILLGGYSLFGTNVYLSAKDPQFISICEQYLNNRE